MSEQQILDEFKNNLICFLDELIDQFPKEPDLIILRIYISDQIETKIIMDEFVLLMNKNEQQLKKIIKERKESFFLDTNFLEQFLEKNKLNHYRKIWRTFDDENKDVVWKWVDTFIYFANQYLANKLKQV